MSRIQQPTKGAITALGVPPLKIRNGIPRRRISRIVVAALLVVATLHDSFAPAQATPGRLSQATRPHHRPVPPPAREWRRFSAS
jgi:hypothetical protein